MISISIHEIIYSFVDITLSPIFYSYGPAFLILSVTSNTFLSKEAVLILDGVYCGLYSYSLAIFALHFVYRYFVISRNEKMERLFKGWKLLFWLSIPILNGVIWGAQSYYLDGPTEAISNFTFENIEESLDLKPGEFVYLGMYFRNHYTHEFYVNSLISLLFMIALIGTSMCVVLFYSIKSHLLLKSLKALASHSTQHHGLQSQLFYALVIQALIPIILMHLPAGVMFLFCILDLDDGCLGSIVSVTIALYPALDPLPTIFVVKHYREAVYNCLVFWRRGSVEPAHLSTAPTNVIN